MSEGGAFVVSCQLSAVMQQLVGVGREGILNGRTQGDGAVTQTDTADEKLHLFYSLVAHQE